MGQTSCQMYEGVPYVGVYWGYWYQHCGPLSPPPIWRHSILTKFHCTCWLLTLPSLAPSSVVSDPPISGTKMLSLLDCSHAVKRLLHFYLTKECAPLCQSIPCPSRIAYPSPYRPLARSSSCAHFLETDGILPPATHWGLTFRDSSMNCHCYGLRHLRTKGFPALPVFPKGIMWAPPHTPLPRGLLQQVASSVFSGW